MEQETHSSSCVIRFRVSPGEREMPQRPTKKVTVKKLPRHKGIVLGIDIGGTGIKGAPVDTRTGKLLAERHRIETPKGASVKDITAAVKAIADHFSWKGRIGCTIPGVVQRGVVRTAANISKEWIGTNGVSALKRATKCSCALLNDADAAGLAEAKFGAGKNNTGLVAVVTLGTGIGTALVNNGSLIPNSELGHLILNGKDAEEIASNRVREENDLEWDEWAKGVESYLQYFESLIWPDLYIIGGGVSKKSEKFLPKIKTRAKLTPAKLKNDAGIIGAALYALSIKAVK